MYTHNYDKLFIQVQQWFESFIKGFDQQGRDTLFCFSLKHEHSKRVSEESAAIARSIGLSEGETSLAKIIGLLHDVGRFPQYAYYGTFNDRQSLDHGALGAAIIGDNELFRSINTNNRLLIVNAVSHHNKAKLPGFLSQRYRLFVDLLRDADKLDIYKLIPAYCNDAKLSKKSNLPKGDDISLDVLNRVLDGRIVEPRNVINQIDWIFFHLGWVFDINFDYTLKKIQERGYHKLLASMLPGTENIQKALRAIDAYIKTRLSKLYRHSGYQICSLEKEPRRQRMF